MADYLSFALSEDFIKKYKNKTPNWGFPVGNGNTLGEITFIAKYSRKKADGTKEQWWETCQRCIEGYYSILKDHCKANRTQWNEFKAQKAAQDAYERMFTFKWLPPGRGLWMMGTEFVHVNQNSAALQNCFVGAEQFITKEYGIVSFDSVVNSDVTVLTDEGWMAAEVKEFGNQFTQKVSMKPFGYRTNRIVDIEVTKNHRWILEDDSETTSLNVGDVVKGNVATPKINEAYWNGIVHGLIFGDGNKITWQYANGDFGFELRACDFKTKITLNNPQVSKLFDQINLTRPSANGDPIASIRSSVDLKDFPETNNASYLKGFLEGWMTADASTSGSTYKLCSQHIKSYDWLKKYSALAGYSLVGHNYDPVQTTNYGKRKNKMNRFSLVPKAVNWKVVSIVELEENPVYCAVVPDKGSFTLNSGIYTGNCAFVSTEKISTHSLREATLPFVRMMEMSMLGVGVGFDTKGEGNLTIHHPSSDITVYEIPDTREGWCESVLKQLESYFFKNRKRVEFDYSKVRKEGEPIKGFGGTSGGPKPLMDLHVAIAKLFDNREGDIITSSDIVDLMNLIGKCVVSGNVRRSAQLALGYDDDEDYLNLKNFDINPERMGPNGWGHSSNNSILAKVGTEYNILGDLIATNGEPGLFYLDLCRQYGRLIDPPNNKDYRVQGTNPCSEQSLESFEMCCLVETFPFNHDNLEDYLETLEHAYLYGKAVTLLSTHWPETNEVMQRNRRIGCSMSGIVQFVEQKGWNELKNWLDTGYKKVKERDVKYSEWLGVRESIKTTSVKPSGTVSLLAGASPGVHWPVHSTYIRRMRLLASDPMVKVFEEAGYKSEPDVMDDRSVCVEFPTLGVQTRVENDVSVWEKASLAALLQRYWADNQVSVTFSFNAETEKDQIAPLIRSFEGQLKSMSFLPKFEDSNAYAQMPYEEISVEDWLKETAKVKAINFKKLYKDKNSEDALGEKFCANDVCEIV